MSLVTGINAIDALVYTSWNREPHTGISLTYSFTTVLAADAPADDRVGFAPMTSAQQDATRAALAAWAAVADITFTEVAADGNIQFGTNDQSADDSAGYAYYPDPVYRYSTPLFLNKMAPSSRLLAPGEYGFTVLLHEIGHTLGLKHPGDYDASGAAADGPFLPDYTDTRDYTQMSYHRPASYSSLGWEPGTPMLYDIQAIQYLYGANTSYRSGADTYTFYDNDAPRAIWDAGGFNTFDFSNCGRGAVIDLRPGEYSSTDGDNANAWIAYGVTVVKAIGGAGDDMIFSSYAGSIVDAGPGHDTLIGNTGSDHLLGGDGTDTVYFGANVTEFTLLPQGADWRVAGAGSDFLSSIERLRFADAALALDIDGVGGQTYRLYRAAFARAPDLDGLGYWIDAGDRGASLASVAQAFVASAEFAGAYGVLDNAAFVTRLYANVLQRAPDPAGLAYHVGHLDQGAAREATLVAFSESAENQQALIGIIGNGFRYTPLAG